MPVKLSSALAHHNRQIKIVLQEQGMAAPFARHSILTFLACRLSWLPSAYWGMSLRMKPACCGYDHAALEKGTKMTIDQAIEYATQSKEKTI
jgi:hypothetical protein